MSCESFFATLECELLERPGFKTQSEARMASFVFIEGWLNYLSPVAFERIFPDGQTVRSATVPRTAGPPKDTASGALHGVTAAVPKPLSFSTPAPDRMRAGAEKPLSNQQQIGTIAETNRRVKTQS